MAKKSVIAGEYIIEIADNGHVDVLRIHRNAKATMEEVAERKAFPVKKSWNTRTLGANLVKEFGDGTTAQFDGITITRLEGGGIEVQEHFKSTKEVLRQIADKVGCRYEEGWNTQRLGSKLTDYLDEHKDKVDKLLTTPNKKRQGEAREGSPSPAELIGDDLHRQLEELRRYYQGKICSVLLIDPMGVLPINQLAEDVPRSLYVDLASEGSIASPDALCSFLLTEGYQGLILDHIEQISRKGEHRAWEYLVKWLLQRESHCPIYSGGTKGQVMDFSQMAVAVRCSAYPDYLRQVDLQAYITEV